MRKKYLEILNKVSDFMAFEKKFDEDDDWDEPEDDDNESEEW